MADLNDPKRRRTVADMVSYAIGEKHGCKRAGGMYNPSCNANCDCHRTISLAPAPAKKPFGVMIVCTDNYARETVAERLVAAGLHEREAKVMCDALNADPQRSDDSWFAVKSGDYKLWRGLEELV